MAQKPRISIYLTDESVELLKLYAEKMKTSVTGAGRVAVELGLMTMRLAEDPKMKKYLELKVEEVLNENSKTG